jgi:hypothetical protein
VAPLGSAGAGGGADPAGIHPPFMHTHPAAAGGDPAHVAPVVVALEPGA